jgi:hypothetical protein
MRRLDREVKGKAMMCLWVFSATLLGDEFRQAMNRWGAIQSTTTLLRQFIHDYDIPQE